MNNFAAKYLVMNVSTHLIYSHLLCSSPFSQTFADDQYVEPYSYYGDNFEDEDNADKYKKLEAPISVWTSELEILS